MVTTVDCVLLAAGSSARMEVPKLLIPAGAASEGEDCTLLEAVIANHMASRVRNMCVVVPGWIPGFGDVVGRQTKKHSSGRIKFLAMARPVLMSESLKSGWAWVAANWEPDAVMISLADKPLVASGIIDSVIDAYAAAGRDICVPVHRGMRGHPVILSRELGAEIEALEGDRGAERVLAARRDRVAEVQVASDAVLFDVDAACDLEQLKARLAESGRH